METSALPTARFLHLRVPRHHRLGRFDSLRCGVHVRLPRTVLKSLSVVLHQRIRCAAACSDHGHHHADHHHHHHDSAELAAPQRAVIGFAKATGWAQLANFLRENLHLCCCATAMFLAAGACPYLLPKPYVKLVQNSLICTAFPLVGVSASLDAINDIAGGKVNIHVLMALAAFASMFMGNSLEGGLLLAMFNLSHIAEEFFTRQSVIDVKELKENHPEHALVLDLNDTNLPNISDLSYRSVPVHDVEIGSYILVGAGEVRELHFQRWEG